MVGMAAKSEPEKPRKNMIVVHIDTTLPGKIGGVWSNMLEPVTVVFVFTNDDDRVPKEDGAIPFSVSRCPAIPFTGIPPMIADILDSACDVIESRNN